MEGQRSEGVQKVGEERGVGVNASGDENDDSTEDVNGMDHEKTGQQPENRNA